MRRWKTEKSCIQFDLFDIEGKLMTVNATKQRNLCTRAILVIYRKS
jgi:hypothetical protein